MTVTRAQLVSPVGVLTASGVSVSGVVTATSFVGNGAGLTGVGIGSTGSVNTTGIITATSFSGSGANITGVVTATSFVGSGAGLTGIVLPISVSSFNPVSGATGVGVTSPSIVITYNTPVTTGVGTITLRTGSSTGTVVESFDAASSNRISINQAVVTISPTSDFESLTNYYLVVPAAAFVSGNNIGLAITTYNFTSQFIVPKVLYTWGSNSSGQLGQNNTTQYSSPVQIPGTAWKSISSGGTHSLGIKNNGTLWAWGTNYYGALGQGNRTQYSSPVQIPGTTWSFVNGGNTHSLAIKTDGTLWVWGYNAQGGLGQNNIVSYSSPVQVPGTTWSFAAGGYYSATVATKTDGTLWIWGYNAIGQLGQSNTISYSSPVQIPGTTWSTENFKAGWSGSQSTFAIKTNGTLWAWGSNVFGGLGQGNTTDYSSPIQIPGTTWKYISNVNSSNGGSLATKTDGTLWGWGSNGVGQLGLNNRIDYSSPIQIPGTTWNFVSNNYQTIASKTDGTLWSWGSNNYGRIGQNNTTPYSSPVQIPGTNWISVSAGNAHSIAFG